MEAGVDENDFILILYKTELFGQYQTLAHTQLDSGKELLTWWWKTEF